MRHGIFLLHNSCLRWVSQAANRYRSANHQRHRGISSFPPSQSRLPHIMASVALAYSATVTTPAHDKKSASPEDIAAKPHHLKKGGFTNPWPSFRDMLEGDTTLRKASSFVKAASSLAMGKAPEMGHINVIKPTFLSSRSEPTTALRATWLGHACYYVEFPGGFRALFDPVFSHRCSPVQFMGPARYTKAPCAITDLPAIDAVIISHNHYDHLDLHTVKTISSKYPSAWFFVPLGNADWFHSVGINNVTELDWWEEVDIGLTPNAPGGPSVHEPGRDASGSTEPLPAVDSTKKGTIAARIGALPCQHVSARGITDRNATLWSSWSVESGGKKVWFAGDTGYRAVPHLPADVDDYGEEYKDLPACPAFKQIGELRGPFDLGMIPIGAYYPRWLLASVHANPYDSVNIFQDTQCRRALAMHWGTWMLTREDVLEPPRLLRKALEWKGLPQEGVFDVLDIGESREF